MVWLIVFIWAFGFVRCVRSKYPAILLFRKYNLIHLAFVAHFLLYQSNISVNYGWQILTIYFISEPGSASVIKQIAFVVFHKYLLEKTTVRHFVRFPLGFQDDFKGILYHPR